MWVGVSGVKVSEVIGGSVKLVCECGQVTNKSVQVKGVVGYWSRKCEWLDEEEGNRRGHENDVCLV